MKQKNMNRLLVIGIIGWASSISTGSYVNSKDTKCRSECKTDEHCNVGFICERVGCRFECVEKILQSQIDFPGEKAPVNGIIHPGNKIIHTEPIKEYLGQIGGGILNRGDTNVPVLPITENVGAVKSGFINADLGSSDIQLVKGPQQDFSGPHSSVKFMDSNSQLQFQSASLPHSSVKFIDTHSQLLPLESASLEADRLLLCVDNCVTTTQCLEGTDCVLGCKKMCQEKKSLIDVGPEIQLGVGAGVRTGFGFGLEAAGIVENAIKENVLNDVTGQSIIQRKHLNSNAFFPDGPIIEPIPGVDVGIGGKSIDGYVSKVVSENIGSVNDDILNTKSILPSGAVHQNVIKANTGAISDIGFGSDIGAGVQFLPEELPTNLATLVDNINTKLVQDVGGVGPINQHDVIIGVGIGANIGAAVKPIDEYAVKDAVLGTNVGADFGIGSEAQTGASFGQHSEGVIGLGKHSGAGIGLKEQFRNGIGHGKHSEAGIGTKSGTDIGLVKHSGAGIGVVEHSGAGVDFLEHSGAGIGIGAHSGAGIGIGAHSGAGIGLGQHSGAGIGIGAHSGAGIGIKAHSGAGIGIGAHSGAGIGLGQHSGAGIDIGAHSGAGIGIGAHPGAGIGIGAHSGAGIGIGAHSGAGIGLGQHSGDSIGLGELSGAGIGLGAHSGAGIGPEKHFEAGVGIVEHSGSGINVGSHSGAGINVGAHSRAGIGSGAHSLLAGIGFEQQSKAGIGLGEVSGVGIGQGAHIGVGDGVKLHVKPIDGYASKDISESKILINEHINAKSIVPFESSGPIVHTGAGIGLGSGIVQGGGIGLTAQAIDGYAPKGILENTVLNGELVNSKSVFPNGQVGHIPQVELTREGFPVANGPFHQINDHRSVISAGSLLTNKQRDIEAEQHAIIKAALGSGVSGQFSQVSQNGARFIPGASIVNQQRDIEADQHAIIKAALGNGVSGQFSQVSQNGARFIPDATMVNKQRDIQADQHAILKAALPNGVSGQFSQIRKNGAIFIPDEHVQPALHGIAHFLKKNALNSKPTFPSGAVIDQSVVVNHKGQIKAVGPLETVQGVHLKHKTDTRVSVNSIGQMIPTARKCFKECNRDFHCGPYKVCVERGCERVCEARVPIMPEVPVGSAVFDKDCMNKCAVDIDCPNGLSCEKRGCRKVCVKQSLSNGYTK